MADPDTPSVERERCRLCGSRDCGCVLGRAPEERPCIVPDTPSVAGGASLPRTDNIQYDLRQRLNRGVRWLREAEDIARIEMPGWPTADRIRDIYEQVSEDVLNGRTSVPPLLQRYREAVAERDALQRRVERLTEERDQARAALARVVAREALKEGSPE